MARQPVGQAAEHVPQLLQQGPPALVGLDEALQQRPVLHQPPGIVGGQLIHGGQAGQFLPALGVQRPRPFHLLIQKFRIGHRGLPECPVLLRGQLLDTVGDLVAEHGPDRILRVFGDGDDPVLDLGIGRGARHPVGKQHFDAQPLGRLVYLPGRLLVHRFGIVVPYQTAVRSVNGGKPGLSGRRVGVAPAGLEGRPALGVGQGPILQAVQAASRRPGVVGVGKGHVIVRFVHVPPPAETIGRCPVLSKGAPQLRVAEGGRSAKAICLYAFRCGKRSGLPPGILGILGIALCRGICYNGGRKGV